MRLPAEGEPHRPTCNAALQRRDRRTFRRKGRTQSWAFKVKPEIILLIHRIAQAEGIPWWRRWSAHSSFCSSRMAPTSRTIAASLGTLAVSDCELTLENCQRTLI
jgi:hypothetical protein